MGGREGSQAFPTFIRGGSAQVGARSGQGVGPGLPHDRSASGSAENGQGLRAPQKLWMCTRVLAETVIPGPDSESLSQPLA